MNITTEQQAFLNAEGQIVLCAVPGSGKTYIVAKKILQYFKDWKYVHRGIAALSFTNVASGEIKRQMADFTQGSDEISYPHFVGTLDSFINNYIFLRFGYLLYNPRLRPTIIHENYTSLKIFPRNQKCHKQGCVQHPEWFCWSNNGLLKQGKDIDCDINPKPCVAFKEKMIEQGMVFQNEVSYLSLILLKKYPQIAKEIAYRFPVIIIDEAQDTSQEEMEILDCIAQAGAQTTALVGDPDQSLYEWRDAKPEAFINKMNDTEWKCMYLTENFRSSQLICDAVHAFSNILRDRRPAKASGKSAEHTQKPVLVLFSNNITKEEIISRFEDLCHKNNIIISPNNVAVLTRRKITSDNISDLWQTTETELLAKATYYWHCSNRKEAYRLCEKAIYNIEIADVYKLTQDQIKSSAENCYTKTEWKKKIIELLTILPDPDKSIRDWKEQIIKSFDEQIKNGKIKPRDHRKASEIIKVKTRDKIHPDFLETKIINQFEKRLETNLTFSSVHGVKGETFDAVLLMVEGKTSSKTLTPAGLNNMALTNELIRIAYVAMTRPRKLLMVSMPKTQAVLSRFPKDKWDYIEL